MLPVKISDADWKTLIKIFDDINLGASRFEITH
jgi:hypothetical protein